MKLNPRPWHLLLLTCLAGSVVRAEPASRIALERLIWARTELSGLRARWITADDGSPLLRATAPDADTARRARGFLAGQVGLERLQVEVDPRLAKATAPEPSLERLRETVGRDPGTRESAALLAGASLDGHGRLRLSTTPELSPDSERRFVRLLLAQPGLRAVSWADSAPASPLAEARREPQLPSAADEPAASEAALEPRLPSAMEKTMQEAKGEAMQEARVGAKEGADVAGKQPQPSEEEAGTAIDQAIEDLLHRAIALAGGADSVRVRVLTGVATFSGSVDSRQRGEELRELARNFDGVSRVTGRLRIDGSEEMLPMDALPD